MNWADNPFLDKTCQCISALYFKRITFCFFIEVGEQGGRICEGPEWEPCDTGQLLLYYLIIDHAQNHMIHVDDYQ